MEAEADGLWWLVVIVTGAVGAAMFIYGVRQKEPLPLVFGIIIGVVPAMVSGGWAAAGVTIGIGALYFVIRKYVSS